MKKLLSVVISLSLIITLCGCGTSAAVEATSTPTSPHATPGVSLSPSGAAETPSPTATENEKVEIKGNLPEFSEEENAEWREKTKENIIDFLENGYSQDDESLLFLDGYSTTKELGVMGSSSAPIRESLLFARFIF